MKSASILLLLAVGVVSAQTPPPPDRFYQAIRRNDLTAVRALVSDEGVDVRDAQRQTPLMLGTALGSLGAVRVLIAASADVKASSGAGLTALHLAADNPAKTRLLLDASADVNAVSQLGRTPLLVAASASTGADVVRQLLAKGADLNVADTSGVTPLIQPSFESGFPYGHDQWISHAATAWATMGLARAAEENLASQPAASAADPFVGTYVFNPAKSTMSGAPPTAEMLLTISDEGDHLVIIPSGKTIDGAPLTGRLIVPKAGGTVPAPPGRVDYDFAIITRTNPHTIQVVRMRQGMAIVRILLELTPDGRTLTRSIRATNPKEQPVEGMSVLERQSP